jgi:peptidoglycan/xylan/chitin deacetylase (PgdA/CDA1 family)
VTSGGRLYAASDSGARPAAEALAWLWRLGAVGGAPDGSAVGFGTLSEEADLTALTEAGRLAGTVLFAPEPGPASGPVPARRAASGRARFDRGGRIRGEFALFEDGTPVVKSSLGLHAVRDERALMLAADPATAWTELRGFWCLRALAEFLPEKLGRPLVLLPPLGCVRLDDVPGTAQHQVEGHAKPDRRQRRRIERMRRVYAAAGARLNVAVCSRALADGRQVPLDEVWPGSVEALAAGAGDGAFEPVCHGWLHLDPGELERGQVEFREFAALDEAEAGRRIDESLTWQEQALGRRPDTFVAPAWGYSEGTHAAAAARGLPAWQRPALGPLIVNGNPRETIDSALRGLSGLDYRPLAELASFGLPPTPVLHGGLFDLRMQQLRQERDVLGFGRLLLRRDLLRLAELPGVRWVGAGELVAALREHDAAEQSG